MQVKAIYDDGVINFTQPLRFKHNKFEVLVNIPEVELEDLPMSSSIFDSGDVNGSHSPADLLLMRIKQILGPYYGHHPASSVEQDKATYLEALEEKYQQ